MLLVAAKYVDDRGGEWSVGIGQEYYAQAELGWVAADPTDPPLRSNDPSFKMRVCLAIDSTGARRRIPCGNKTATAYTGGDTAIVVSHDDNNTAYVATVYGYEGERRRFRVPASPAQG